MYHLRLTWVFPHVLLQQLDGPLRLLLPVVQPAHHLGDLSIRWTQLGQGRQLLHGARTLANLGGQWARQGCADQAETLLLLLLQLLMLVDGWSPH